METNNYVIATIRQWNIHNYKVYFAKKKNFHLVQTREELNIGYLKKINPRYIFFPHWSWIIPEIIFSNFECVIFHTANLPEGRGGSPLQNLILSGRTKTKVCALRAIKDVDAGDIYLKRTLSLSGSAEMIFKRLSRIVFTNMIPYIVKNEPQPKPQAGKISTFKRRSPEESDLSLVTEITKLFDFIRMLDAPEYPKAFLETEKFRFEFSSVRQDKKKLTAVVEIHEK